MPKRSQPPERFAQPWAARPTAPGLNSLIVRRARRRSSATAAAGATVGESAAQAGQEARLPASAGARRVDRVDRGVLDQVGAHDPYPVKLDLVLGHVEADQRHDHLAGRGRLVGVGGDHREDGVDGAAQTVAGDVELGLAVPEPDHEADRGLLAGDLAHLDEGLQPPQLGQVPLDELPRQRRVGEHRQWPVVGWLEVEGHLRPARQQLLEQVGCLDGEPAQRLLEALGGALKRRHAPGFARRRARSCGCMRTCNEHPKSGNESQPEPVLHQQ